MFADVGMVGGDDEDGAVVPRLLLRCGEKTTQRHIDIAYAGVHGMSFEMQAVAIGLGNHEGMMRRGGEHCRHERLLHIAHGRGIELQERLVPDGPCTIEIAFAAKTCVSVILCATIITLEACGTGKGLEPHRAVFCPVEERRGIAFVIEFARQTADTVERIVCHEERLYEHGDARQY